jgi:hypothetical protein
MDLRLQRTVGVMAALGGAVGCAADDVVELRGVVQQAHDRAEPLAGAAVEILDARGQRFDRGETTAAGAFRVTAPLGAMIFATVNGEGLLPAAFLGQSGVSPVARVEEGVLYGFSTAEEQAWRERFAGCPGADQPGGIVLGEVRFFDLAHPDTGEHPLCETGIVTVERKNEAYEACYLTEDGSAWDPDATETGTAGTFAIFGLPEGSGVLKVDYRYASTYLVKEEYPLWLPAEGVAPWFPAWVELPL